MSDIEQRLRNALDARAALVQPEDLTLSPVLDPPELDEGPWWQRPGAYLFVAAVAIIVIALPLLVLATTGEGGEGDRRPDGGDIATNPSGDTATDGPDEDSDEDRPGERLDRWWEDPVAGLPAAWGVEGGTVGRLDLDLDVDGDGTGGDSVSLAGSELVVDAGAERYQQPVDGPNPHLQGVVRLSGLARPVILVHTTDGATGTTYVSWSAYAVIDGELARLGTAPLGPTFGSQYSNLTPDEGGHSTTRTWLVGDDALYGMDFLDGERAQVDGPDGEVWAYRVRVRSWRVEEDTMRATTLGSGCVAPQIGMQISRCPSGL